MRSGRRERLGASARLADDEAFLAQVVAERLPDRVLILDDQHVLGGRGHETGSAAGGYDVVRAVAQLIGEIIMQRSPAAGSSGTVQHVETLSGH
jgi:hypothetical protein